jgi:DNA-binding NarL/FixJ family response regulator
MHSRIRVFLVDDHQVLRSGLRALLGCYADLEVVGEAGDGAELLACLPVTPTDVVVLDVLMPGMDGQEAARLVQEQYPEVAVLGLSMVTDLGQVVALLEAGFRGYVSKAAPVAEMALAIRQVAAGSRFLSTELGLASLHAVVAQDLPGEHSCPRDAEPRPVLTKREAEVLQLVAEGLSNEEVATRLFTSKRTIETHRQNIIAKTNTKNTAALIGYAARHGLV